MLRSAAPGRKKRTADNGSLNNTNSSAGYERSTLREIQNSSQLTVNNSQMDVEALNSIPKGQFYVYVFEIFNRVCC